VVVVVVVVVVMMIVALHQWGIGWLFVYENPSQNRNQQQKVSNLQKQDPVSS
jgi:hypothetical protein